MCIRDRHNSVLMISILSHVVEFRNSESGLHVLHIRTLTDPVSYKHLNTIPNTGISLPFFSSGGTSLMMLLGEMGIVLSVSRGES